MEKMVLSCSAYFTFIKAFKVCFALYFNFNIMYPKGICTTLEMIQRYHLKIHPDSGTKSKKICMSKKKVVNLITQLAKLKSV